MHVCVCIPCCMWRSEDNFSGVNSHFEPYLRQGLSLLFLLQHHVLQASQLASFWKIHLSPPQCLRSAGITDVCYGTCLSHLAPGHSHSGCQASASLLGTISPTLLLLKNSYRMYNCIIITQVRKILLVQISETTIISQHRFSHSSPSPWCQRFPDF